MIKSKLKVGQQVVAIGNALGYGQSVTTGIVSALDREVTRRDVIDVANSVRIDCIFYLKPCFFRLSLFGKNIKYKSGPIHYLNIKYL